MELGADRIPRISYFTRNSAACLHLRPSPRRRCRPHRTHRQRCTQVDADTKAAGLGGLLFCFGPLAIVVVAFIFVALTMNALQIGPGNLKEIAGEVGTSVSAFFLF